jgi:LptD protein
MGGGGRWWLWTLMVGAAFASGAAPLAAQESQVDSTQLRILERLRRLSRPPGADSVLFVQDSVKLEEARNGRRSGAGAGGDSITAELLSMPGFSLTEYSAASANFGAQDRVLVLQAAEGGRARVNREGVAIEADTSITYSEASGLVSTVGDATLTPDTGDPIESASMIFDLAAQRGSATDAKTSFSEGGARWNVRGDMPYAAQDSTFMSHATFTSCELEVPHYHFETDEIKIVGGKVLIARPVRLYFGDVPVAWLPFIAQSLSRGRASGLLTPRFSVNDIVRTSGGYRRRVSNVGFYWAMSDYSDALFAIDWFSDNFLSLTSSIRYKFSRQFLDGDFNFRRYWRQDGSTELALDTRHSWEIDERTQARVSGRFASSNDFVRRNSFNPREVTQSIDSEGGINRRFGWGSLSLAANRKQYLSDDRTEWTLPSANLSLSTITLFRAPSNRARFWNNMTWSGSSSFTRRTVDRVQPDTFDVAKASTASTRGSFRSSISLGSLTLAQSLESTEQTVRGFPEALLLVGDSAPSTVLTGAAARDIAETNLNWSLSMDYQQQLIGSTTLTPRVSITGSKFRSDTSSIANSFVSAPSRIAVSAQLKTDIYGFYGGFGSFEAIRHKISPSFSWSYSPGSTPDELQQQVFRSRALQPRNTLSMTLNQTWEAKRKTEESDSAGGAAAPGPAPGSAPGGAPASAPGGTSGAPGEPRRAEQSQTVNLLALRTSVVKYDFVEADSAGSFLSGFETTRLSNQISSDYLRGLSVSIDHDLFDDTEVDGKKERKFAPHLSQVNFSFSLGSRSSIFRWLGFLGGGDEEEAAKKEDEGEEPDLEDPFQAVGATDESSIVPTARRPSEARRPRSRGSRGGWNANLSYSLQRPRDENAKANQMLTGTVTLRPTEHWDVSWRTAYDLERGAFNDHTIRLTRDLHRWQANFDFLQTATGNWTFRFEVSLMDNRDLKFDYQQRNLDVGLPSGSRR